jgi:hypothetical protein
MEMEQHSEQGNEGATPDSRESGREETISLPVACTLTPDAMATRKAALLTGLVCRAEGREEIADGLRFEFPADTLSALFASIEAERQCCRFLRFEITIEPDGGPIWLSLTGPHGTREFLAALIET